MPRRWHPQGRRLARFRCLFFFNDTATTEIYTLSLHDALPIWNSPTCCSYRTGPDVGQPLSGDRKSTRLNSSHANISYAVFCLKKKQTHPHSGRTRTCTPHISSPSCLTRVV